MKNALILFFGFLLFISICNDVFAAKCTQSYTEKRSVTKYKKKCSRICIMGDTVHGCTRYSGTSCKDYPYLEYYYHTTATYCVTQNNRSYCASADANSRYMSTSKASACAQAAIKVNVNGAD